MDVKKELLKITEGFDEFANQLEELVSTSLDITKEIGASLESLRDVLSEKEEEK